MTIDESGDKKIVYVKKKRSSQRKPRIGNILGILRILQKNDGRILKQMAKTRAELGTQLTALTAAVQALLDKITAGQDFQAEFDSVQAAIDSLNTAAAGL